MQQEHANLASTLTITEMLLCDICCEHAPDHADCPDCGVICPNCSTFCPCEHTYGEMIAEAQQKQAAALARFAEAEAHLRIDASQRVKTVDHHFEDQRQQSLDEIAELSESIKFLEWCMVEDRKQAALPAVLSPIT